MTDRKQLIDMLIHDEGMRGKPYRCTSGKLTIGVGRNLDDVGLTGDELRFLYALDPSRYESLRLTEQESLMLLNNDIDRVTLELANALPLFLELNAARQMVLINMAFNLGMRGLLSFRKMLAALKAGDYDSAAKDMLDSEWARQVGGRAKRLTQIMKRGTL